MTDAAISILASFLDRHGVTAAEAAQMTPAEFRLSANLCRLQSTPDQAAVIESLKGRQARSAERAVEFRARLARLERETR